MTDLFLALNAEWLKLKRSPIVWISFLAFGLAPLMAGLFMLLLQYPDLAGKAGSLYIKARMMNFSPEWPSFLAILQQALAVGGILVFGFVASWIFGREFSDGTLKDLLALPVRRSMVVHSKFTIYLIWCLGLSFSNLITGTLIGAVLNFEVLSTGFQQLTDYLITSFMVILSGIPVAIFASWGKGYLAPLGYVALTLVLAQIIAAAGFGRYFPWAVPGLFSDISGGMNPLTGLSYVMLLLTGMAGYILTLHYWKNADHLR